jgi:acyl-CoA hydrolase
LIGKGRHYEPDVVILKVRLNEFTGEYSLFISVNTAIGVDLFGNVWADFIDPRRYYSGVGGQPDFIRALNDRAFGTPSIAHPKFRDDFLRSVYEDPIFTKPIGFYLDKTPRGVQMYRGKIKLGT